MNAEWSLDVLFSGFDDPAYEKTLETLEQGIRKFERHADSLQDVKEADVAKACKDALLLMEEITVAFEELTVYASLRCEANTRDAEANAQLGKLYQVGADESVPETKFKEFVAGIKDLDAVIEQDEILKEYSYMLHNIQRDSKYLLSAEVEMVLSKTQEYAGNAWTKQQSYLTSTVAVEFEGKKETLSSIRNKAYADDKEIRKKAYEAELAAYDKIKDAVSFSLNSIKMQNITETKLRGFESPIERTLYESRMKRSTLDAMFEAIDEYLPKFHAYLKAKAAKLGYTKGLPWYELFAPMGKEGKKFTAEEAGDYLVKNFASFDTDLSDMIKKAFDEAWIDFYPREGKVGGAFCAELNSKKQSRILTNFDGTFGDVVTLAHELGHAFHNVNLFEHRPLNHELAMQLAETASTFNENVITQAAIEQAQDKEEKMHLVENQLQDLTQVICDIYSRYLFETEVFEKRADQFLYADDLCEIMLNAQKKAYGDGLDHELLHPYMWICKGHYYSAGLSFYNFPYAFGALFARGLFVKYQTEGKPFVEQYRKMLHMTTVMDIEEAAAVAGIDITDKSFWKSSLQSVSEEIDSFLEMC